MGKIKHREHLRCPEGHKSIRIYEKEHFKCMACQKTYIGKPANEKTGEEADCYELELKPEKALQEIIVITSSPIRSVAKLNEMECWEKLDQMNPVVAKLRKRGWIEKVNSRKSKYKPTDLGKTHLYGEDFSPITKEQLEENWDEVETEKDLVDFLIDKPIILPSGEITTEYDINNISLKAKPLEVSDF